MVGESDVVLDASRVLEPRTRLFFPTFMEWVSDGNAEQVVHDLASGTFTVPDQKTLFITNLSLSYVATVGSGIAFVDIPSIGGGVLVVSSKGGGEGSSVATSYPMPIKVSSGGLISVAASQPGSPQSIMFGFLLDKKISIR